MSAITEWNAICPRGKGLVFLGEEHIGFGVSMWNQMQCLDHIRAALVNGVDSSNDTAHCFHYLRQGILCAADTTLESSSPSIKTIEGDEVAAGVETVHTCRDWRQVYDWMESEYDKRQPEMHESFEDSS